MIYPLLLMLFSRQSCGTRSDFQGQVREWLLLGGDSSSHHTVSLLLLLLLLLYSFMYSISFIHLHSFMFQQKDAAVEAAGRGAVPHPPGNKQLLLAKAAHSSRSALADMRPVLGGDEEQLLTILLSTKNNS
jgi:hypothetical protein